jgi:diketogulonate reductase-like aldo/keto reductase
MFNEAKMNGVPTDANEGILKSGLNRREFLQGMLVVGAVGTLGVLTACSSGGDAGSESGETLGGESPSAGSASASTFELEEGTVALNNGIEMPVLGIGTYMLSAAQAEESVYQALSSGCRLVDTANAYMNERAVGRGIKKSGVPREEVFVSTKLWPSVYGDAEQAIDDTLARLDLDYIDLLLPHQAFDDYLAAYQAMEAAVSAGKVRAIGLSNFYQERFDEVLSMATITPAVLQNERNPYFQQAEMREYIKPYGTILMDWFPLGGRSPRQQSLFRDDVIIEIAEAHGSSAAQVILRWHIQSGSVTMPGSSNSDHIVENITISGLELTDDEMQRLNALDTDEPAFDFRNTDSAPNFGSFTAPMDFNAQE